jgi:HTH-type transcriptional regulator, quorum sensing regulator NprR
MISQIESDRVQPSVQLLQALAERLGVSFEELLPAKSTDQERLARYKQAQAFLSLSHEEQALPLLLGCLQDPHPTWSLLELNRQTARCHHLLGQCSEARLHYEAGLRLAMQEGQTEEVLAIRFELGRVALSAGDLDLALHEWELAYADWKRAASDAEPGYGGELCLQLGHVCCGVGRYEEAIIRYREANGLLRGVKAGKLRKQAELQRGLGHTYERLERWDRAAKHFKSAASLFVRVRNLRAAIEVRVRISVICGRQGWREQGLRMLGECLEEAREMDEASLQVQVLLATARLRCCGREWRDARAHLEEALGCCGEESPERGQVYRLLAEVHGEEGDWTGALAAAEQARLLLEPAGRGEELLDVYGRLVQLYKRQDDYRLASLYLERSRLLLQQEWRTRGWWLF